MDIALDADEVLAEPADDNEPIFAGDRSGLPRQVPTARPAADRSQELRRELRASQRVGLAIALLVVLGASAMGSTATYLVLRGRIADEVRAQDVSAELRALQQQAAQSVQRIGIIAEDVDGKAEAVLRDLKDRAANIDATAAAAMQKLADHAAAARKGFQLQVSRAYWQTGEPAKRLIHASEGVCFMYEVSGQFDGVSDAVAVDLDAEGYWQVRGQAENPVRIGVMAVKIIPVAAPPAEDAG